MSFHIGQKVVCIRGGKWRSHEGTGDVRSDVVGPQAKVVYTIRDIVFEGRGLIFDEIRNFPLPETGNEPAFERKWFKPVRTTDISIFKAMLVTPPKQRVRA